MDVLFECKWCGKLRLSHVDYVKHVMGEHKQVADAVKSSADMEQMKQNIGSDTDPDDDDDLELDAKFVSKARYWCKVPKCKVHLLTGKTYKDHMRMKHEQQVQFAEEIHECDYCECKFDSPHTLLTHIKAKHEKAYKHLRKVSKGNMVTRQKRQKL